MKVIALVGMGPRGAGLLERLVSNAGELGGGPLEIHLIDPYPVGGGRVWRNEQSALLRLNSTAEDVTAFLDDSIQGVERITPGPTLYDWVVELRPGDLGDPELEAEASSLGRLDFASRRLASAYFAWAHEQVIRGAPAEVNLVTHRQRAVDLAEQPDGAQLLTLEDRSRVRADAVVLLSSHVDTEPGEPFVGLTRFAERHGLSYLPPAYGGDVDLEHIRPGQDTIVRGFGLGFVDLMILLTEGRGGRFVSDAEGLTYLPSGREPRLHVGSRRGVPYHCKPMYHLRAPKPSSTTFCTPDALGRLLSEHETLEFRRDVWPLVAKEVSWTYYVELGLGHPGRISVEWDQFAADFAQLSWGTPEFAAYLERVVTEPADRLDLDALDRPLSPAAGGEPEVWAQAVRDYIRADIDRRLDPHHSADLGAFHGFLAVLPVLTPLLASTRLTPESLLGEFFGWYLGLFNFYASGPPPDRLEQLLALERAGVVSFLGPELSVSTDEGLGAFVARSPAGEESLVAHQLVDARLPALVLSRATDPLLRGLFLRGEVTSKVLSGRTELDTGLLLVDAQQRVVDAEGRAHERRFSLGMHTTVRPAAFARPGSNGPVHRLNDLVARSLLRLEPVDPGQMDGVADAEQSSDSVLAGRRVA